MTESLGRTARRARGYERDGLARLLLNVQERALAELDLTASDRFLDVGCATGAAVRAAAGAAGTAVGVDLCEAMIRHARLTAGDRGCFARADVHALPFLPGTFTALLCTSALRYFDDPTGAASEMRRVLEPGGRLVLGDFDVPRRRRGSGAARLVEANGFRVRADLRLTTALGVYVLVSAEA